MTDVVRAFVVLALLVAFVALARGDDLPDPELTPGAVRTDITLVDICTRKWGTDVRHVTPKMRRDVLASYGGEPACVPDKSGRTFELDHLVSRELGGADVTENLWPQCYTGEWNAVMKDRLENALHKLVCDGSISLRHAQGLIASDWRDIYRHLFSNGEQM